MALTDLLVASQNPGKLAEMRLLLSGLPYRILSPADVGLSEAPAETGTSFVDNALIKARHYSLSSGLLSVADDSGLSVGALGGAPGLFSSRFGGDGADDSERNRLLLSRLEGVPAAARGAIFTSAVALARSGRPLFEVVETAEGLIVEKPRGSAGFGYDPIFFYPPLGKTFGELPREEKDRVSHRGKAFARLREFLLSLRPSEP